MILACSCPQNHHMQFVFGLVTSRSVNLTYLSNVLCTKYWDVGRAHNFSSDSLDRTQQTSKRRNEGIK